MVSYAKGLTMFAESMGELTGQSLDGLEVVGIALAQEDGDGLVQVAGGVLDGLRLASGDSVWHAGEGEGARLGGSECGECADDDGLEQHYGGGVWRVIIRSAEYARVVSEWRVWWRTTVMLW